MTDKEKLCRTCIYGDKTEYDKPCVVCSDDCQLYEKKKPMTVEEAIKILEEDVVVPTIKQGQALSMALNALEQQSCEDCVSREAVINIISIHLYKPFDGGVRKASCYGVLKRIEKQVDDLPSVTPTISGMETVEDCINRQAAIDFIIDNYGLKCSSLTNGIRDYLPSVTPQPKTGKWIIIDDCELFMAKCSECGEIVDSRMINKYPYCHCGAKMEVEE